MSGNPRVKIVATNHPHRGEYGHLTGEVIQIVTGAKMAKVRLECCKHGMDGCFISPGDVRQVNENDQYVD